MSLACCLCYKSSSSFHGIRVVHLNGFVEDFNHPVMACELTGKPPKYFICTSAQLLSFTSSKTLPPDTQLQRGQVYFLLPFSIFESETSSVDLAYLSNRLTAAAKRFGSKPRSPRQNNLLLDPLMQSKGRSKSMKERVNPYSLSSERNNASQDDSPPPPPPPEVCRYEGLSNRSKSWKPILEAIIEKSFGRLSATSLSHRSESFEIARIQ